jgi:hypothetical protein
MASQSETWLLPGVVAVESRVESGTVRNIRPEHESVVAARERILRLVGMAPRPLRWAELQSALGLLTQDARLACEWLMDHGYLAPMQMARDPTRPMEAVWTLGDRGRAWAKRNGALTRDGSR